jgi:hypothetical protein
VLSREPVFLQFVVDDWHAVYAIVYRDLLEKPSVDRDTLEVLFLEVFFLKILPEVFFHRESDSTWPKDSQETGGGEFFERRGATSNRPWMPTNSGVGSKRELGICFCECSTEVSKLKGCRLARTATTTLQLVLWLSCSRVRKCERC